MNQWKMTLAACVLLLGWAATVNAGTFTTVYNIFQTSCAAADCHGSVNPHSFSVDGSENDVYNALVGAIPENEHAAAMGYKLVEPGHPYNSFLLRKIGSDFDDYLALHTDEGDLMPAGKLPLKNYEIELVRQWIMKGARKAANDVDYQVLQDYYTIGGLPMTPAPTAPDPSEGMQIRFGPIFLAPGAETEWDKKEHLNNAGTLKVYRTDGVMSWQSHHMLLFKYQDDGSSVREGMRLVPSEAVPFNGNTTLTGAWQNDAEFPLPEGTAFFWQPNTVLEFDYHIKNYSQTEILPSDFYLNIYFDTENTRNIEMHAALVNNLALLLFQGNNTRVATDDFNEDRYIYMMSSHAHQWGKDFDIYLQNADNSRGDQIYEGFYNEAYTFNQGYFDWEHPPVKYFEPLQKASHGLIYETKWNVGVPYVTFGLTADDEMMLFTYLYTREPLPEATTGIHETPGSEGLSLHVYPNPFDEQVQVKYNLEETADVKLEVFDVVGKKIATLADEKLNAGNYSHSVSATSLGDGSGLYLMTLTVNGVRTASQKLTKVR